MNPPKTTEASSTRSSTTTAVNPIARKPWKKKTPADVVLDQINKVRDDVAAKEEDLKYARRQLQKLEEARKVLEAT
jgi:hypothetical protein